MVALGLGACAADSAGAGTHKLGGGDDDEGSDRWSRQWGSGMSDLGTAVALGPAGLLYVGGHTQGTMGEAANAGEFDAFVSMLDGEGQLLWTQQWGSDRNEHVRAVAPCPDGGVFVGGSTEGDLEGDGIGGPLDGFVTKLDAQGNILWTRELGDLSRDLVNTVTVSGAALYAAGWTESDLGGEGAEGEWDAFVARFDPQGNLEWLTQWGTDGFETVEASAPASGGGIYASGYTSGELEGQSNAGTSDAFVTKLGADGEILWTRLWGSPRFEGVRGMAEAGEGGIYVAGRTDGDLTGVGAAGDYDAFLTRIDSGGTIMWSEQWGTGFLDQVNGVAVANDGVVVTGSTRGDLTGGTTGQIAGDAFVASVDANARRVTIQQWGSTQRDSGESVAASPAGDVYVAGWTQGDMDGEGNAGYEDAFLTKLTVGN